jgi:hypothetical protein
LSLICCYQGDLSGSRPDTGLINIISIISAFISGS